MPSHPSTKYSDVDFDTIDPQGKLRQALIRQAIAWARADRQCEDLSAALIRASSKELANIETNFQAACRHVDACDTALRQTAHLLIAALEGQKEDL